MIYILAFAAGAVAMWGLVRLAEWVLVPDAPEPVEHAPYDPLGWR